MKKILIFLLCTVMILCGVIVYADSNAEAQTLPLGEITLIEDGMAIDLDGDGRADEISLEILKDEYGYDYGYRLRVNDKEMIGEGWAMAESVYALKLQEYHGTLLMISDYGPSDDYETYFYLYEMDYTSDCGELLYAGSIPSLPDMMDVNGDMISASIRADVLCTWYRDADFAVARSMGYEEALRVKAYEIPRYLYSMGIIATLNVDLPLFSKMDGMETEVVLSAGEQVILCATDDKEWILIESMESGEQGWMRIQGEFGYDCVVGDRTMFSDEVFAGLPFAD